MRKIRLWALAAVLCFCGSLQRAMAQTDLTGSIYENPNIMADEMKKISSAVLNNIDSIRTASIAKQEKEKGRKLTSVELAEVEDQIQKAQQLMAVMHKAVKNAIKMEFTTSKNVVMHMEMSVDDNALKLAGVSWARRKAMKAAMAVMPEKQKGTYEVKGNLVIVNDGEKPDTMRLSDDRKHLYGQLDPKTKFTLTKTK